MNYQSLNSGEKARLVMIILDFIEEPLEFDDFQDTVGLLCEDISGFEFQSDESLSALVSDCWVIFQQRPLPLSGNR